jgi:hypothetical protein
LLCLSLMHSLNARRDRLDGLHRIDRKYSIGEKPIFLEKGNFAKRKLQARAV